MHHIVGTFLATSPVHQSSEKDGNESSTMKTYVWGDDRNRYEIPFVSSNSQRGLLRREATELLLKALNKPVSRQLYQSLTSGKGLDIRQPPVSVLVQHPRHVFAGLFGGGAYMLRSIYSLRALTPLLEWTASQAHHSLRDRLIPADKLNYADRDGNLRRVPLTSRFLLTVVDDFLAGKGADFVEDHQKSLDAYITFVKENQLARAKVRGAKERGEEVDEREGRKRDVKNMAYFEAMLPGTPLQFWLSLEDGATDAQIGFMLMAVRDLANRNAVGGCSSRGFGRFDANLALYNNDTRVADNIFNLTDHVMAYSLNKHLSQYVYAAETALAQVTLEDLVQMYPGGLDEVGEGGTGKTGKKGKGKKSGEAEDA